MKSIVTAIILALTITNASAQAFTCRPVGTTTVCSPTPAGGSAGIAPALAVVVVLFFVIQWLNADNQQEQ